ncbi:hypothetical protein QVN42_09280 [Yersinia nurmii]|uniref:Uncharacterized protein n=1 Tax=Yersinia nurmii TaxID=685706 RepID=A0AAW7K584_9GAMM|nr:hypothetical protein [Yersinia nurmii]MDN0087584.1 hypothetical protein [Yersinia nurmii]
MTVNKLGFLCSTLIIFSATAFANDRTLTRQGIHSTFTSTGQLAILPTASGIRQLSHISDFPDFEIKDLHSYYRQEAAEYEIKFDLKANGILSYYIYVINSNNTELININGFINNDRIPIRMKMHSIQPGYI